MTYVGIEDWQLITLFVASLFVGILGGCVGMALGVVRVPLMTLLGIDPLLAAGSNLMVSLMGSTAGSWPAFRQKRIIWTVVLIIGIPSIIGSFLGAFYANLFPHGYLLFLIGIILSLSSISIIFAAVNSINSKKQYQDVSADIEFQRKCLDQVGVAMIPGTSFGKFATDHVRFNFATSRENISKAIEKICLLYTSPSPRDRG